MADYWFKNKIKCCCGNQFYNQEFHRQFCDTRFKQINKLLVILLVLTSYIIFGLLGLLCYIIKIPTTGFCNPDFGLEFYLGCPFIGSIMVMGLLTIIIPVGLAIYFIRKKI